MNKQEAQKQLDKVQAEATRLQEIIEAPEGRWRASEQDKYWCISSHGSISNLIENGVISDGHGDVDNELYKAGNYFRTEEEAKKSNIYKVLNSEYEYYFAGVSDNFDDVHMYGSAEWYSFDWVSVDDDHDYSQSFNYRWKRI